MNYLIRTIRGKKLEMQKSNMSNWKAHYLFCCVCVENTNDLTLEMLCCVVDEPSGLALTTP